MTAVAVDRAGTGAGVGPAVDVSVLVPVLDEEEHLPGVLKGVLSQDYPGPVEFLFIDGGSRDRSRELLERAAALDARVRVLDNPHRRTPHALNIGLRAARGTWIARMDAHTHYRPDYLRHGVARIARGDVVSVGGPAIAVGTSPGSRRTALALSTPLGVGGAQFRKDSPDEVEVDSGFAGLWHRDVLHAQGGWDEAWVNDQDTELAARLRKQGGRIVCLPGMAADYVPRAHLRGLARQYFRYGTFRVRTSHRHPESLRRSQLLPPGLVLCIAAAAIPTPVRGLARLGTLAWGAAVAVTSARAARSAGAPARDGLALPAVYAVMHLSYGAGFLHGCARLGPPVRALRRAVTGPR